MSLQERIWFVGFFGKMFLRSKFVTEVNHGSISYSQNEESVDPIFRVNYCIKAQPKVVFVYFEWAKVWKDGKKIKVNITCSKYRFDIENIEYCCYDYFSTFSVTITISSICSFLAQPLDTRRKLNVHKTFRRRPRRLLNVLCVFNLCPVFRGGKLAFVHILPSRQLHVQS